MMQYGFINDYENIDNTNIVIDVYFTKYGVYPAKDHAGDNNFN